MTEEQFGILTAMLRAKPSYVAWDGDVEQCYAIGLAEVPATVVPALAKQIATECSRRPEVPELLTMVRELLSPDTDAPDAAVALREVREAVQHYGLYGRRVPGTYRYEQGCPPLSHPLIEATIQTFGGWDAVCGYDGLPAAFTKHFMDIYDRLARDAEKQAQRHMTASMGALRLTDTQAGRLTPPALTGGAE